MGEHKRRAEHASKKPVPLDVYRVVICGKALCDKTTDLLTFVDVHEVWSLSKATFGEVIPVQAHFGVAGSGEYEVRVAWVDANGELTPAVSSTATDTLTIEGRQRFAVMQLRVPKEAGTYSIILEWRHPGDLWQRSVVHAPIHIIDTEAAKDAPAAAKDSPS